MLFSDSCGGKQPACIILFIFFSNIMKIFIVDKRQTSGGPKGAVDNTDVMVKNILKWLQSIYGQNNRKTRQGAREYLPPINTEKPRPFQAGYPAAGPKPSPSFDGYDAPYKPAGTYIVKQVDLT